MPRCPPFFQKARGRSSHTCATPRNPTSRPTPGGDRKRRPTGKVGRRLEDRWIAPGPIGGAKQIFKDLARRAIPGPPGTFFGARAWKSGVLWGTVHQAYDDRRGKDYGDSPRRCREETIHRGGRLYLTERFGRD